MKWRLSTFLALLLAALPAASAIPPSQQIILFGGSASQGASTDPAALAWKAAVVAASGTVSATQLARVSSLISCYKTNNIWSIRDRTWLRASENTTQANLDIVNLQTSTPHGTITFTAGVGYAGDGSTGYIDTNFVPSSAGGNYSQNSATLLVYILANRHTFQNYVAIGAASGTNIYSFIQPYTSGGSVYEENGNTFPNFASATAQGLWITSRTSNTAVSLDQNGTNVGNSSTSTSNGLPAKSILVGAFNDTGSIDDFSTDQWAADGITGAMTPTQRAAESSCLNAYMASLSINVYASAGNPASVQSTNLASIFSGHAASTLPQFGINTHETVDNLGVTPIPPANNLAMAQTLGVSLVRIDAVDWQNIEGSLGVYSYTVSDPFITGVSGFRTAGMTVQLIVAYSNTLYEATIFTGPTDSAGKTAYNNYAGGAATGVVAHYGATGFIYELWNEPNIGCGVPGNYAWSLTANASDYSTLATGAAAAIVGRTAAAKIITAGLAPTGCGSNPAPFGTTMNTALTWTNFQGAGLHPYNNGVTSSTFPEQSVADSAAFAAAVTNASAIYWSEVGYTVGDTSNSESLKGVYDSRLVLSAVLAQTKQIALYELASSAGFGLFDSSFNILPAGTAYKNLITALTGCTTIDALQYSLQSFWEVTCHVAGGVRRIVWSSVSSFVFVSNESSISAASATDLFGNSVPVTVNGSAASISLTVAGGPVVLTVTN